jgi:hypothetical protein
MLDRLADGHLMAGAAQLRRGRRAPATPAQERTLEQMADDVAALCAARHRAAVRPAPPARHDWVCRPPPAARVTTTKGLHRQAF